MRWAKGQAIVAVLPKGATSYFGTALKRHVEPVGLPLILRLCRIREQQGHCGGGCKEFMAVAHKIGCQANHMPPNQLLNSKATALRVKPATPKE